MQKLILPDSFGFDGPVASLVRHHSKGIDDGWFSKRAAAESMMHAAAPAPGHSQIHLIAMGVTDIYGPNRNGDGFYKNAKVFDLPEGDWTRIRLKNGTYHTKSADTFTNETHTGLRDCYRSFKKHANVYWNHKNKKDKGDPTYGQIKAAAYNEPMERVELLIEVPDDKWAGELEKLANDQDVAFSMSCTVPYDICSACGHKAKSRNEYCKHAAHELTLMRDGGHIVHVINENPRFFDISKVNRPADRIAFAMTKAAEVIGSAELAMDPFYASHPDIDALMLAHPGRAARRLDLLRKAAELEKKIPMSATFKSVNGAFNTSALDTSQLSSYNGQHIKLASLFKALNDRNICLPLKPFVQLIAGTDRFEKLSGAIAYAEQQMSELYNNVLNRAMDVASNFVYDDYERANGDVIKVAKALEPRLTLDHAAVQQRAIRGALKAPGIKMNKEAAAPHPAADALLDQYAAYQLSFLEYSRQHRPADFDSTLKLCMLQNFAN